MHNASKVISFLRDCQDKPLILNGVRTDASSRFYYRSCQQDLCNDHDGRGNSSGGDGSGTGGNHNGIVPGKNGGVSHNQTRMTLLQAAGIMLLLLGTCNYNFN
ncbi:uncharacterized protein LOC115628302 isoform X2 [Scaptodrosophila lebanonensis]|uniref:Uncharacterized protein LOC115628302 isoform X2 n=1 Tax=Drosophila lebanonensis TaxID=7225 RepID=A0A6J2TZG5_DROLE|nr:uncharacterized protein LOC115628302 isoform X2 [Scaptodrosophila lebanonensis]